MVTLFAPTKHAWNDWSSPFGETEGRSHPHTGIDYGLYGGGPELYAGMDGIITAADYSDNYNGGQGGFVDITNGRVRLRYMHQNRNSDIGFNVGASVTRAQLFALMGDPVTGEASGRHCHLGMWIDGQLVDPTPYFTQDLPISPGAPVAGPGVYANGGWDGISTLYQGPLGLQGNSDYYIIGVGEYISMITERFGIPWQTAFEWSQAYAASKWGAVDGFYSIGDPNLVFAGYRVALKDLVAQRSAEEASQAAAAAEADKVIADVQATLAAARSAQAQREADSDADATTQEQADSAKVDAALATQLAANADAALKRAQAVAAAKAEALRVAVKQAKELARTTAEAAEKALSGSEVENPDAPLAGILADAPRARKRSYIIYALLALALSIAPDLVLYEIIPALDVPGFTKWIAFLTSTLLKIGAAFGFVAAANVSTKRGK